MAEAPGWTYGVSMGEEEGDLAYAQYDRIVGAKAADALTQLSADLDDQDSRQGKLTTSEIGALFSLQEIEWLGSLMVPPEDAWLDGRLAVNDKFRSLYTALPFHEAERWWLLQTAITRFPFRPQPWAPGGMHDPPIFEERRVMVVGGVEKTVEAKELLERFWLWRRELGDYSAGEGLREARLALSALVDLLSPQL